jgi:hypothetical protein
MFTQGLNERRQRSNSVWAALYESHSGEQMTHRQITLLAALAISVTGTSTSSFAFTAEAQQMCTGDAMRLSGSEIPNISKVAACMHQQRAKLSAGCRAVMDRKGEDPVYGSR